MLDPKNDNLGKRYTENLTLGEYFDGQNAVIFKTSLTLQPFGLMSSGPLQNKRVQPNSKSYFDSFHPQIMKISPQTPHSYYGLLTSTAELADLPPL